MEGKAQQVKPFEEMTREELAQALCDMIESAPREIAEKWLHEWFLPKLEEKRRRREGERI